MLPKWTTEARGPRAGGGDFPDDQGIEQLGPPIGSLIDGEPCEQSDRAVPLIDPSTGEPFGRLAIAGPEDLDRAVDSAARASAFWRGTSFEERGLRLRRLQELIRAQTASISQLIAREQGKPYLEALTLEVLPALDHLRFITRHAEQYRGGLAVEPRHPFYAHKHAHYMYDALGVLLVITPSPLPFAAGVVQVAAALAMGNAVILKPSERTPLCGLYIGQLCKDAGFPDGLVNIVMAEPEGTLALVSNPRVDKVFFTGGVEAGQHVMAAAGSVPHPAVLLLGGKHPAIVAADADEERAARGIAWGALANAGQNCGAVERVYVEEAIASRFLERLLHHVDRVRIGNPLVEGTDMGPLNSAERREDVHRQVLEAVDAGARLIRGGELPEGPGFFYPPTVLLDAPPDCRLMREETLGPVIPIVLVDSLERAILLANDSDYALTASGWTRSEDRAERMMVGLQAGVVTINDLLYSYGEPAATWSGSRKSGTGQKHGTPGLREMSRQRFVSFDPLPAEAPVFAFPYDAETTSMAETAIQYFHGRSWFSRFRALVRLLRTPRFRLRIPVRSLLFGARRRVS